MSTKGDRDLGHFWATQGRGEYISVWIRTGETPGEWV